MSDFGGSNTGGTCENLTKNVFWKKMKNVNARRVFYLGMYFSIKAVKELFDAAKKIDPDLQ